MKIAGSAASGSIATGLGTLKEGGMRKTAVRVAKEFNLKLTLEDAAKDNELFTLEYQD